LLVHFFILRHLRFTTGSLTVAALKEICILPLSFMNNQG